MDELAYWLLLLKAPLLGLQTFYKALSYFESPDNVFTSTDLMRKQSGIFKAKTLEWLANATPELVSADLAWQADNADCHILTFLDEAYPTALSNIYSPPPILYVRGELSCLNQPQIAMVGSRNPTPSGLEYATMISRGLSQSGLTIISGLATGIDAQSHLGALEAGGKTIGICGTGLDRVYPAKHKNLAKQITQNGALVSEFTIGTPPIANNFPKRNRLISGMSLGVLVVEAREKSGSLITARIALEQNKEVFAMPSSIYNVQAKGCHKLIKQGAVLVEYVSDILENINFTQQEPNIDFINKSNNNNQKKLTTTNNILLKYLTYTAMSVDELMAKSGLSAQIINQYLLVLELEGKIHYIANAGYLLR